MSDQTNRDEELRQAQYYARIGELFLTVNSADHDEQCRALAMTDWQDICESDAVALLAPLSTHTNAEVRQIVALQLAATAGSAEDPRALQALVTLAADEDPMVRAAAARSSYIAEKFSLTPDGQSGTSPADRFVEWQHEGEMTTFSFRCLDISTAKRIRAILTGLSAREMTHPSNQRQPPAEKSDDVPVDAPDGPKRLPDVIMDEEQPEVFDLPRQGVPKAVLNVSKASVRLPDVLIDE